jgi:hypothetical protein
MMAYKLVSIVAALLLVAAVFSACEPGRNESRDCPKWWDDNKCKNIGDACDEVAVQFSTDDGVTAKTTGGRCLEYQGKPVCAPVRNSTGACKAVIDCDYEKTDIFSCSAQCTFINGSGAGSNNSYVCDFNRCQDWYNQNVCKNSGDDCTQLALRFTTDAKTKSGSCAWVTDIYGKSRLSCVPVRLEKGACKAVDGCTWGTGDKSCEPTCTAVYGMAWNANESCDFTHCSDWYFKNKCVKAGDDCSVLAAFFLNSDGKTTAGVCADYKGKIVCAPVRSETGFCQVLQECPYGKGDETCNPSCTILQGYLTAAPGACALPL